MSAKVEQDPIEKQRHIFGASSVVLCKLKGHKDGVLAIDTHPLEAHLFVTGSDDCTARLWDLRSGHAVKCFACSQTPVSAVMFDTRLSNVLFAVMDSHNLCSFDLRKEGIVDRIPMSTFAFELSEAVDVNSISMHSRERLIALADDEKITLVDLTTKKSRVLTRLHSNVISKIAFKPNASGDIASCGFDYVYNAWDYRNGRSKWTIDVSQYQERSSNEPLGPQELMNPPFVHDFAYLNSGRHSTLALGDGTICVVDNSSGTILSRDSAHQGMATTIDSCRDNRCRCIAVSGGVDKFIQIWELINNRLENLGSITHGSKINSIRCSKVGDIFSNSFIVADVSRDITAITLRS